MAVKPFFTEAAQVGIVVEDAEKTARYYAEELGIGPWKIYDLKRNSADQEPFVVAARGWLGSLEFEFISPNPNSGTIHEAFLKKHGNAIHHIQYRAEDYDECYQRMVDKGYELMMQGGQAGGIRYAYFDTTAELGCISEIADFPPGSEEAWKPDRIIELPK